MRNRNRFLPALYLSAAVYEIRRQIIPNLLNRACVSTIMDTNHLDTKFAKIGAGRSSFPQ